MINVDRVQVKQSQFADRRQVQCSLAWVLQSIRVSTQLAAVESDVLFGRAGGFKSMTA